MREAGRAFFQTVATIQPCSGSGLRDREGHLQAPGKRLKMKGVSQRQNYYFEADSDHLLSQLLDNPPWQAKCRIFKNF
jgi:hypothetical protein